MGNCSGSRKNAFYFASYFFSFHLLEDLPVGSTWCGPMRAMVVNPSRDSCAILLSSPLPPEGGLSFFPWWCPVLEHYSSGFKTHDLNPSFKKTFPYTNVLSQLFLSSTPLILCDQLLFLAHLTAVLSRVTDCSVILIKWFRGDMGREKCFHQLFYIVLPPKVTFLLQMLQ